MGSSVVDLVLSDCKPVAPPTVQPIIGCVGPAAFSVSLALSRKRSYTPPRQRLMMPSFDPMALFHVSPMSLNGFFDTDALISDFNRVAASIREQSQHDVGCGVHYFCSPIGKNIGLDVKKILDQVGSCIKVFVVSSRPVGRIPEIQCAIEQIKNINPNIDIWVNITQDAIDSHSNPCDLSDWIQQTWCLKLGVSGFIFDLCANHAIITDTINILNTEISGPLFRFFLLNGFTRDFTVHNVVRTLIADQRGNINFLQQNHLTTALPCPLVDHLAVANFFYQASGLLSPPVDDSGDLVFHSSVSA